MGEKAHTEFILASLLSKAVYITQGDRDMTPHPGQTQQKHSERRQARATLTLHTSFMASRQAFQCRPAATTVFAHTVNTRALSSWQSEGISPRNKRKARQEH